MVADRQEEEVALRREDALLFRIWDTWKANARTLPAISFNKKRVLRLAFDRILYAHHEALAIKSFSEPKHAGLLGKVFEEWKLRARAKTVARVGYVSGLRVCAPLCPHTGSFGRKGLIADSGRRVRGRIRPSLGTSTKSPATSAAVAPHSGQASRHQQRMPSGAFVAANLHGSHETPAYARLRSELSASKSDTGAGRTAESIATASNVDPSSHLVRALRDMTSR